MNATRLLESQHRETEALLARLFSGEGDMRRATDELGHKVLTLLLVEGDDSCNRSRQ
jgi:hypothetical protein